MIAEISAAARAAFGECEVCGLLLPRIVLCRRCGSRRSAPNTTSGYSLGQTRNFGN